MELAQNQRPRKHSPSSYYLFDFSGPFSFSSTSLLLSIAPFRRYCSLLKATLPLRTSSLVPVHHYPDHPSYLASNSKILSPCGARPARRPCAHTGSKYLVLVGTAHPSRFSLLFLQLSSVLSACSDRRRFRTPDTIDTITYIPRRGHKRTATYRPCIRD